MPRFERKQNIFQNKDALGESYQPERIEERDEEIEAYMDALQPIIDGWEPNNIFLYGNTGVGKTAVTEYLLDVLQEDATEYDDVDLSVLGVNCKTLNSSYQVAVELVNTLRPAGARSARPATPNRPFSRSSTANWKHSAERWLSSSTRSIRSATATNCCTNSREPARTVTSSRRRSASSASATTSSSANSSIRASRTRSVSVNCSFPPTKRPN